MILRPAASKMLGTPESDSNATVQAVLDCLPDAQLLHLACHGQQDPEKPLASGFRLRDGPLALAQLMRLSLPNAFLAFLSACETAKGDAQQPDQAVHLAAAMLFVGFRSVVATMWCVSPFCSGHARANSGDSGRWATSMGRSSLGCFMSVWLHTGPWMWISCLMLLTRLHRRCAREAFRCIGGPLLSTWVRRNSSRRLSLVDNVNRSLGVPTFLQRLRLIAPNMYMAVFFRNLNFHRRGKQFHMAIESSLAYMYRYPLAPISECAPIGLLYGTPDTPYMSKLRKASSLHYSSIRKSLGPCSYLSPLPASDPEPEVSPRPHRPPLRRGRRWQ